MPIVVTDEMVQAARRLMPARWSMQDLHDAIEAALRLASPFELTIDLEPSEEQREGFAAKLREQIRSRPPLFTESCVPSGVELMPPPVGADVSEPVHTLVLDCRGMPPRLALAFVSTWNSQRADPFDPRPLLVIAPPADPDLDPAQIADEFLPPETAAIGEEIADPIYPVRLGGVSEIADAAGVARSTVSGWIKRAEAIGMPAPLAQLTAGPVYDLDVVEAWYREWKDTSDAAA